MKRLFPPDDIRSPALIAVIYPEHSPLYGGVYGEGLVTCCLYLSQDESVRGAIQGSVDHTRESTRCVATYYTVGPY